MKRLPQPKRLERFAEGLVFWILNRLPAWMVADYASDCLDLYDLDTARDIMADQGALRGNAFE